MVKCFGRDIEFNAIMSQIEMYSSTRRIIYLQGEPHIGKTLLKSAIAEKMADFRMHSYIGHSIQHGTCPVQYAKLDCRDIREKNQREFHVIDKLYQQMKKWKEIKFPRYELARMHLFNKSNQTEVDYKIDEAEWSGSIAEKIIDALIDISKDAGKYTGVDPLTVTITVLMIKAFAKKPVLKGAANIKGFFERKFYEGSAKAFAEDINDLINNRTEREIEAKLTEYLWKDLQDYGKVFTATNVILLDTYELFSKNDGNWIYSKLLRPSRGVFWIVFGTSPYAFDDVDEAIKDSMIKCPWPALEDRTRVWQLRRFSIDTSRDMLQEYGIKGKDVINSMLDSAHGLPGALRMLIDTYGKIKSDDKRVPTEEDFRAETRDDNLYRKIMENVYIRHITGREKDVLCFLSELDEWDENIYMFYAKEKGIELPDKLFERLTKESIVQSNGVNGYRLLDGSREVLQSNNKEEDKQDAYRIAYRYYKMVSDNILKNWSEKNGWDSSAYRYLQSNTVNAVRYGVRQYTNVSDFKKFSSWFVVRPGPVKGIQQQLTDLSLFSLKAQLLELYLSMVEEKDRFQYDKSREYQLQAHYDLGWSWIYLHSYSEALKQILHRLHLGLLFHDSLSEENVKCIYSLGVIFQRWGRYEDSEFWHKVALEKRKAANVETEIQRKMKDILIAISLNSYADALMNNRKFEEAENLFQESFELRKKALEAFYPLPEAIVELKKSPAAEHIRGIIVTTGNMSKLYFLKGTLENNRDLLEKAREYTHTCIEYCIMLYEDNENTALNHKVRLLTADFQTTRLSSGDNPYTANVLRYISEYLFYIEYWDKKSADTADTRHNLLNTKHNLSVVYAYHGQMEDALNLVNDCIAGRRSKHQVTQMQNDKNIKMALDNLRVLQADSLELEKLELIY